jgi:hypothetical protein
MRFQLSTHAANELQRRSIPHHLLTLVLEQPEQFVLEHTGRKAHQSQLDFGGGRIFLLRAIVRDDLDPLLVVTVYRTSKIAKYWRVT